MNPGSINPNAKKIIKEKKSELINIDTLSAQLKSGNTSALARAITLVESNKSSDTVISKKLLITCNKSNAKCVRIGITGSPGVGKSSFIESFGLKLLEDKSIKIAVLTYDPISPMKGGSILGDKTRMQNLSNHERAFVRPSPSGLDASIHDAARHSIELCENAGYNYVLIETVGAGQSETAINHIVDYTLLLISPNSGDELQGIKRGIMEIADLIIVNKDDTGLESSAKTTQAQYQNAIKLLDKERVKIMRCSSVMNKGIEAIKDHLLSLIVADRKTGSIRKKRNKQKVELLKKLVLRKVNNTIHRKFESTSFMSISKTVIKKPVELDDIAEKYYRLLKI